ncbi:hypothetical protein [Parafrigoribacterium humi]|uniref:hypothetical protein n=1 Tax=Parafrigoribacterium humi TaxID=3144664 RepID=UPI0032ED6FC9
MTIFDTWLDDGAVLATVHVPRDAASTGVVICPPIGYDYMVAYRSLRYLADQIAASGLPVIRYEHPGFGDSTVPLDTNSFERGAREAVHALLGVGCTSVAYVGLGSGALVASLAAALDPEPAGLVLWDPVASGRKWMRQKRSIYSLALGSLAEQEPEGFVEIAGAEIPREFAEHVDGLDYDPDVASTVPTLVAVRVGTGGRVPRALRAVQDDVDVIEISGHEAAFDGSSVDSSIPGDSVDAVAEWLASRLATSGTFITTRPPAVVDRVRFDFGGTAVEERLRRIGPHGLFAIETRPAGGADDLPAVILHNGSAEHRTGATRHQVELARQLAAQGVRAVRVDRRGTGESGPVHPGEPKMLFAKEWLEDGADVIADLALPREKVGIVGMCVGSWVALVSAPGAARFVTAFSMRDYHLHPVPHQATTPAVVGANALALRERVIAFVKRRAPYLAMLALANRGIVQFVEPGFRVALAAGTDVTLLLGPEDTEIFRAHRGERAVRRLRRLPGRLTVVEYPTGDHALFSPGIRARAMDEARAMASRFLATDPGGDGRL